MASPESHTMGEPNASKPPMVPSSSQENRRASDTVSLNACDGSDEEGENAESYCENSPWVFIPEPVFANIFLYLQPSTILRAGQCCKRWNKLAKDDFIWRKYFRRDFKVDHNIPLRPGAESWRAEYRRLTNNVPMVLTDVLTAHSHQVLHVSFSHNGKLFATCSKDGFVIVWTASYPSRIRYSYDMQKLSWKYTQYSQFNQSDTLLLVSGVHLGSPHSTSGEIAVFTLQGEFRLKCRVNNSPYDIFGTWFSDQHLLSGDLTWLAHLVSSSILWLNKANQEVESEHTPVRNRMYKFYNRNASSIRVIMVANCPWLNDTLTTRNAPIDQGAGPSTSSQKKPGEDDKDENSDRHAGNPVSLYHLLKDHAQDEDNVSMADEEDDIDDDYDDDDDGELEEIQLHDCVGGHGRMARGDNTFSRSRTEHEYVSPIQYLDEYRREYEHSYCESSDECREDDDDDNNDEEDVADDDQSDVDDLDNLCPKYLIFSTGSKTYTPHQVGFKRINNVNFPRRLDPGPTLKERIALRDQQRELEVIMREMSREELRLQYILQNETPPVEPNWANYDSVAHRFDKVDKLIDLHGHIIGMGLSPDHRYLYVNSRPWPKNCVIRNPLEPPAIAQEIDIHVIDLMTLKEVGNMLRAHKAYTPNTECFFIFLDVSDHYVASGAEDMHAYLWDRYYGVCLTKYQHSDVVNSVAFNPRDNEMLVTTSDDFEIKVWRSLSKAEKLRINPVGKAFQFRKAQKN